MEVAWPQPIENGRKSYEKKWCKWGNEWDHPATFKAQIPCNFLFAPEEKTNKQNSVTESKSWQVNNGQRWMIIELFCLLLFMFIFSWIDVSCSWKKEFLCDNDKNVDDLNQKWQLPPKCIKRSKPNKWQKTIPCTIVH